LGQKTHPIGYRLIVNKKWRSNWFAPKNNYSNELEEDVRIRKYISHRLPNAGISKVEISRTSKRVTITIFTARPGIVIGRGGEEVNRLKKELRQLTGKKDAQSTISEAKRPELVLCASFFPVSWRNSFFKRFTSSPPRPMTIPGRAVNIVMVTLFDVREISTFEIPAFGSRCEIYFLIRTSSSSSLE
jgi:hypothetical protein